MTGLTRPSSLAAALALTALALCAVLALPVLGQDVAPPIALTRLCITWGGGDATTWIGQLRLDKGSLSDLKLLSVNADAAGSMWVDQSQVRINSLSPHKSDSIEVVANGAADAKLLIELSAGPKATPSQAQVPLADLARRPYQQRLDNTGNTLEIRAIPEPSLHISFEGDAGQHDALIFAPGETLSFELAPLLPATLHGTTLDIQTTLSPARRKNVAWTGGQRLAVPVDRPPKADVVVPLQVPEGVYTVRITVSRSSGYLRDKFFPGAATAIAERSFEIVVVDTQPPAAAAAGGWEPVLEIDPTNPRWVERLPEWTQLRRIPGINSINHGSLGSIRAGAVDSPLGRFIELPPTVGGSDPHWQAYSLPLEAAGTPHLLEINYPADEEQHFGLSIVEPNAAGDVEGIQRDGGVYVEGLGRSEAKQKETHRLVFWPRTQAPLLVVTNQHPTAAAHFGPIRVLKRTGPLGAGQSAPHPRQRMIATYIARPYGAESFGATDALDVAVATGEPKSVDDYQTFYEIATRLAESVHYGGYNSAVVSVMADGSSIFPSARLPFTPRYETGRSADRVRDIDGLELTLRIFDREQLMLVPAIEFTTPIPQLEELRRSSDPQTSGLELVDMDGRTWLDANGTRDGSAPYYNMLDPRVQQAMLDVVRDIVERYGAHPAFGGLAVQLTSDGYTQLPTLDWGFDDATIERFSRDTGIQLGPPGANRFAARHAALTGPHANAWRTWRTQQVAAFYDRLAVLVRGSGQRKLLLTTEKLFDHPQINQRVRPNLLVKNRVAATMLDLGIDRELLERTPGVVLCLTQYVEPMSPLPDRAVDMELNAAFARGYQPGNAATKAASVLYHRPLPSRLASFAASSPFRIAGEMRFLSHPMPSGLAARQPYVQALLRGDPAVLIDGGDSLPLGHEDLLRTVRNLLGDLPASAQVSDLAKQSVVVRTYAEPNQVTMLVMNMGPWHTNAQVTLDVPKSATLAPLSAPTSGGENDPIKSLTLPVGRQPWNVSLEPYDMQAVRIAVPGVKAIDMRATLGSTAIAELKRRVDDLANRDVSAPHTYRALANPSFEPLGGGPLPGWRVVSLAKTASAVLDATNPQDGKTSLYIRNDAQFAAVESDAFPIPSTGQLAMTVFVRGQNMGPGTELRFVFESESGGKSYRRSAKVQGVKTQRENQQWGGPCIIPVPDLPLDTHGQMRIKFELTGPGEVWLDNVTLNDLLFSVKLYENSQADILQLLQRSHEVQAAFDAGQLKDCIQMLDEYWPRFVLAYTPPTTPVIALAPSADTPPATAAPAPPAPTDNKGDQPAPGFSDRIKRIVPLLR